MQRVCFETRLFTGTTPEEIESGERKLRALLAALVILDLEWIRTHPQTPELYRSGVAYEREPPPRENWQDVPTAMARGKADCEDLACWRVAELRLRRGVKTRPIPIGRRGQDGSLHYHIVVRWPDGTVEDPSKRLGMGGPNDVVISERRGR